MSRRQRSLRVATLGLAVGCALLSSACTQMSARHAGAPQGAAPMAQTAAAPQTDAVSQAFWAARNGEAATLRRLLAEGVDPDTRAADGETLLLAAASSISADTVQALLDAGADANAASTLNGWTPLMTAAFFGGADCVRLLLDKGADIDATNHYGETALLQATFQGQDEVVKTLLARGADASPKNDKGFSALRAAKYKKFTGIVQALEESGARR